MIFGNKDDFAIEVKIDPAFHPNAFGYIRFIINHNNIGNFEILGAIYPIYSSVENILKIIKDIRNNPSEFNDEIEALNFIHTKLYVNEKASFAELTKLESVYRKYIFITFDEPFDNNIFAVVVNVKGTTYLTFKDFSNGVCKSHILPKYKTEETLKEFLKWCQESYHFEPVNPEMLNDIQNTGIISQSNIAQ